MEGAQKSVGLMATAHRSLARNQFELLEGWLPVDGPRISFPPVCPAIRSNNYASEQLGRLLLLRHLLLKYPFVTTGLCSQTLENEEDRRSCASGIGYQGAGSRA